MLKRYFSHTEFHAAIKAGIVNLFDFFQPEGSPTIDAVYVGLSPYSCTVHQPLQVHQVLWSPTSISELRDYADDERFIAASTVFIGKLYKGGRYLDTGTWVETIRGNH